MSFRKNFLHIVAVTVITSFCTAEVPAPATPVAPATPAASATPATPAVTAEQPAAKTPAPPYIAEIISQDVYVRSGPGTGYYYCSKANPPETVHVVDILQGWAKIIPPTGSFSWIHRDSVKPDQNSPDIGIITANDARVWAGSDFELPARSSSLQVKLNKGDTVKIIGKQQDTEEYCKIAPPAGAYLWVSAQYLKYARPVAGQTPTAATEKTVQPDTSPIPQPGEKTVTEQQEEQIVEPEKKEEQAPVVPVKPSPESEMIKQCQEIVKQVDAEVAKPLDQQDYQTIKDALKTIVSDPQAGRAKLYAEYQLERISRYELVISVQKELRKQETQLDKAKEQIEKERQIKIEKASVETFIITGRLKKSNIYTGQTGPKRYIIANEQGKILCYAVPVDSSAEANIESLMTKKVGLVGQVVSNPSDKTTTLSLIKFTKAVPVAEPAK